MRAMLLSRPAPIASAPLAAAELDDEAPGPGEVAIEIGACGVCRTDLQIAEGDLAARTLPIVPGHQIVGRIVALGAGVSALALGDRVGVGWLASTCGTCEHCTHGRENLCMRARFTGWDRNGGYATRTVARADFCFPLPHDLPDDAAAPLLCGGVIGYRALKVSGIQPGGRLGLYGFGASASLAIQIARHWGCEIYVATRSREERERAGQLGAVWCGDYGEKPPRPLDAVVTFAPVGRVVLAALQALDRGGTVAINAIHLDGMPAFDYGDLWWERTIRSVANYTRSDARELLALAATIPIVTSFEAHPLEDANVALARIANGQVRTAAVLRTRPNATRG